VQVIVIAVCSIGVVICLAAFLQGRSTRDAEDEAAASAKDPPFWSPPARLRVLFVANETRETPASRADLADWYEATLAEVSTVAWGRGRDGYDSGRSLAQNIAAKFGSASHFDAVVFHGENALSATAVAAASRVGLGEATLVVVRLHDCWSAACQDAVAKSSAEIFLVPSARDVEALRARPSSRKLVMHVPYCAPRSRFFEGELMRRPDDAVALSGAGKAFPLRARWQELIARSMITGSIVRGSITGRQTSEMSDEEIERVMAEYAASLKAAKLALLDSSIFHNQFRQFVEAALAGALIVSDLPLDDRWAWSDAIAVVNSSMSDQ
jgi:hypothetical protein